jgi:hypothetical protein
MGRIQVLLMFSLYLSIAKPDAHAQVNSTPPVPSDFNFVLQYGFGHVLDTGKGTFTRDGSLPQSTLTVGLWLTPMELVEVYRGLVAMDFWNSSKYPESFRVPLQPNEKLVTVFPGSSEYILTVTSRGVSKRLRWHDTIFTAYQPASELRTLFRKIRLMVESKPEYKNFPPSKVLNVD